MRTLKQWAAEDRRLSEEANLSTFALMEHRWKATRERVDGDKPRFNYSEYGREIGIDKQSIRSYALGWELHLEEREVHAPQRSASEYLNLARAGDEHREALKIVAAEEGVSISQARLQHNYRVSQVASDLRNEQMNARMKEAEAAEEAAEQAAKAREAKDEGERAEAEQHRRAARERAEQARKEADKAEREATKRAQETERIRRLDAKKRREEEEKRRQRAESDSWVKFFDALAPKFHKALKEMRSAARVAADAEARVDEREFLDWIEEQVEKVKQAGDLVLLAAHKDTEIDWDGEFAKLSE